MIGTAVKCANSLVIVFDRHGEQIPGYQGQYTEVRDSILRDASRDTVFVHLADFCPEFLEVNREEW